MHLLSELSAQVAQDPALQQKIKDDPVKAIAGLVTPPPPPPPLQSDKWIYRMVVGALGLAVLIAISGAVALTWKGSGEKIPDIMTALGSAAVGALAGLLAPSPVNNNRTGTP